MTVSQHGRALEYDLMTRTRFTLDDLGGELSTRTLLAFVTNLPPDSALLQELRGDGRDEVLWQGHSMEAMLMAEMADTLHVIAWETAQANSKHDLRSSYPEQIERPGVVPRNRSRHFGSEPVKVSEFDEWWNGGVHGKR